MPFYYRWEFWLTVASVLVAVTIALAAIQQARLTRLIAKPGVEIFVQLSSKPTTLASAELFLEVANLSTVGAWLEAYEVVVTDRVANTRGKPAEYQIGRIVAPCRSVRLSCHEKVWTAQPTPGTDRLDATVKVVVRYRVHQKWHTAQSAPFHVVCEMFTVHTVEPCQ